MSELAHPKVVVVMPARQAAATLEHTFAAIPQDIVDEVILVDDSSTDDTVRLASTLPLHLVWHPHQTGYGATRRPAISRRFNGTRTWWSCSIPTASTSPS